MRITGLFALVLGVATLGCGDDIKFPDPPELPDPALNGVNPPSGFTSRTIDVQVSGDATEFTSEATVTFGAGITVDSVTVASPSLLIATITIAGDAAVGPRDVIVTDGANTTSLLQAFEVRNSIDAFVIGTPVQGGFVQVLVVNRDTDNPWIGNTVLTTTGTGWNFSQALLADPPQVINPFQIVATVFFDVDATPGTLVVEDTLETTLTTAGPTINVAARTPVPLQPVTIKGQPAGQSATAVLSDPTALFSFQTTGLVMADAFVPNKGEDGLPAMIFLKDGKWTEIRGLTGSTFDQFGGNDPVPVITNGFIVVLDVEEFVQGIEVAPYTVQVDVNDTFFPLPNIVQINEAEPNGTPATANDAGAQHLIRATIDDDFGNDVFKVTVADGERLRVQTTTGTTLITDTVFTILRENPAVPGTFITVANSGDAFLGQGVLTGPLTAGDHFISVSDGFDGFPPDDFEVAIDIVPAPVN